MTERELIILHRAQQWHKQQSEDRQNRKKKRMHKEYAEAIGSALMELKWNGTLIGIMK